MALFRCNEAQGGSESAPSAHLHCGSGVSHLGSLWGSGQASLLVNQAQ